jgi:multidrug resistance efflux pump
MLRISGQLLLSLFASALSLLGWYGYASVQPTSPGSIPAAAAPAPQPAEPAPAPRARAVESETIKVGSPLAGAVQEVLVSAKLGQPLKAGTPLFRVEDRTLQARLKVDEANLAAAEAHLAKVEAPPRPEDLAPYETRIHTAQANLALLEDQFQRAQRLHGRQASSDEEYLQRRLARDIGREQLAQARADLEMLKAGSRDHDKALARAQAAQARAQLEQTRTELERALVRAPVDGVLLQVNVHAGDYVGAVPTQPLVVLDPNRDH